MKQKNAFLIYLIVIGLVMATGLTLYLIDRRQRNRKSEGLDYVLAAIDRGVGEEGADIRSVTLGVSSDTSFTAEARKRARDIQQILNDSWYNGGWGMLDPFGLFRSYVQADALRPYFEGLSRSQLKRIEELFEEEFPYYTGGLHATLQRNMEEAEHHQLLYIIDSAQS